MSIRMGGDDNIGENWTLSEDGYAFVARFHDTYKIEVFDKSGELRHVIQREYKSVKISDEQIASMKEEMSQFNVNGRSPDIDFNEYNRDIETLYPRPNGELWVSTSRSSEDCGQPGICALDVFDSEGRFLREQNIEADYDPKRDQFSLIGDYLFIYKEARTTPQSSTSSGGGMMTMMIRVGGSTSSDDDDEDSEPKPFSVICYDIAD